MLENLQYLNDNRCLESFRFYKVSGCRSVGLRWSTSKACANILKTEKFQNFRGVSGLKPL